MTVREWNTVEEHVADALCTQPSQPSQQEEPVESPVTAALSAIWQQAEILEADTTGNFLPVILSARHVGKSFKPAQCVAIADFIAAIEAENRAAQQAIADGRRGHPYPDEVHVAPNGTGPHRVLQ